MKRIFIALVFLMGSIYQPLFSQCSNFPQDPPSDPVALENANRTIAECFAPTVKHMTENTESNSLNGRSDLITSVFYDGDMNTGNNWDNLVDYQSGNPSSHDELDPVVYYSVVWTNWAWIVTYAFYHPRDYSGTGICCPDNHENDLEGTILVIWKALEQVGGAYTISHHTLIPYDDVTTVPTIFIDNGTHAVEANIGTGCINHINPCDNCKGFDQPHITYDLSTNGNAFVSAVTSGVNSDNLVGTGRYLLDDIFGSHSTSLNNQRDNPTVFTGDKFFQQDAEPDECQDEGSASAPWGWGQFGYTEDDIEFLICSAAVGTGPCSIVADPTSLLFSPVLIENNPYFPEICTPVSVEITDDFDWTLPESFAFNEILVKAGVKLTVTDRTINFANDGVLILESGSELILDKSTLTNCEEATQWRGIVSNQGADIEMIWSRIENAEVGLALGGSSGASGSNNNTFIMRTYSGFSNCLVGLDIGPGQIDANLSGRSWFSDCETGIVTNQSSGLVIDRTEFYDNTESIRAVDSYIHVRDGNAFHGGETGIRVEGTYPGVSGVDIGDMGQGWNFFASNIENGIISQGGESPAGSNIVNCRFSNVTSLATGFGGSNQYIFYNNTVENSPNGVFSFGTGDNFNNIGCNEYKDISNADNLYLFNNQNSQFLGNESNGTHNVNYAMLSATVADNIGSSANPAGNCFSDNGIDILTAPFWIFGPGTPFVYHYYNGLTSSTCLEPFNNGNYTKSPTTTDANNCSGGVGIFNLIDPDDDGVDGFVPDTDNPPTCTYHIPLPEVKSEIINWINIVVNDGGDDPRTETDEAVRPMQPSTFQKEKVLDQWIRYAIYRGLDENDYTFIENVLTPLKKWKWRKQLCGIAIRRGKYTEASTILNEMPQRNEEEIYFVEVQRINLMRLVGPPTSGPWIDQNHLNFLKMVGESEFECSGYARSLYRVITGQKIPYVIPDLKGGQNNTRSNSGAEESLKQNQEVLLYPNPVKESFELTTEKEIARLSLMDITGKLILEQNDFQRTTKVDMAGIESGMYLVRIEFADNTMEVKRIVKQ